MGDDIIEVWLAELGFAMVMGIGGCKRRVLHKILQNQDSLIHQAEPRYLAKIRYNFKGRRRTIDVITSC